MGARPPGPLGVVLSQVPRAGEGHVRGTVSGGNPSLRGGLKARASVHPLSTSASKSFHCRRGQTITLDSTGSSAQAREFEWSFVADQLPVGKTGSYYSPESPPPPRHVEGTKTGKQVKVFALASFTATLVVRDGLSESPPHSIDVRVQPRDWTTHFIQRPQIKYFSKYFGAGSAERLSGCNACTECGHDLKDTHWIHRGKDRTDWKGQFQIAQVNDPGGPFHGLWYVAKLDLHIDRTSYLNSELTTGQVFRLNHKNTVPQVFRDNLKARVESTKLHEELHGHLVEEALRKPDVDPAPWVECLIGEDQASLAEQANSEVARKEGILSDSTAGTNGHGALRELLRGKLKGATSVRFLLPESGRDEQGIEYPTDLLEFDD